MRNSIVSQSQKEFNEFLKQPLFGNPRYKYMNGLSYNFGL